MNDPVPEVAALLERQATRHPERVFFRMNDTVDTYADFNRAANRVAQGLSGLDVTQGDMVAVMMPNSPAFMYTWFGILKLGAVEVPINTAFRGQGLVHLLKLCEARVVIIDEHYVTQLDDVFAELDSIKTVVVHGDTSAAKLALPCEVLSFSDLLSDETRNPTRAVGPYDRAMVLFTSGTTGRSKGCVLSHRYLMHHAELIVGQFQVTNEDTLYSPFPLFHADATYLTVLPAMLAGCSTAISERFSASRYWDEIRTHGATVFDFMGATLTILWKQPPRDDDADNPVRLAWGVPMPEFADAFEKRFDLQLAEVYGLTDAGVGVFQPLDEPRRPGAAGKPVDRYQYKIFDPVDNELPANQTGEIVVRPNEPGIIMDEYLNMPNETLAVIRNLWFHTGDLGFIDEAGYLHFVERKKDAIRRRGENISAFEIEEAVNLHPSVLECAAIGVPSELTEEEVMVWVVLKKGQSVTPQQLTDHCQQQVAAYMVPRYVQFVEELPKTPTEKVEKYKLSKQGVSAATWDREAAAER